MALKAHLKIGHSNVWAHALRKKIGKNIIEKPKTVFDAIMDKISWLNCNTWQPDKNDVNIAELEKQYHNKVKTIKSSKSPLTEVGMLKVLRKQE